MKPPKYWFAWYPVRTDDTHKIFWLRKVYKESYWNETWYFEHPIPF